MMVATTRAANFNCSRNLGGATTGAADRGIAAKCSDAFSTRQEMPLNAEVGYCGLFARSPEPAPESVRVLHTQEILKLRLPRVRWMGVQSDVAAES